jgi:retron-type reverse transcriptase
MVVAAGPFLHHSHEDYIESPMAFWSWVRGLFGTKSVKRDVTRLEPAATDVNLVEEVVDTSGGRLKPATRRRAMRDPRLLPKTKPILSAYQPRGKRKKVMEATEAKRLFSASLRTRNRHIRDLLTDEEQLARYGLPEWCDEADLAQALGMTVARMRFFSIHRARDRTCHYVTFAIPKRDGGERLIMAPKRELKQIQRRLLELLVSRLPVSPHAHGFLPGHSIRSNAEPHRGRRVLVQLDIADFFPTVHVGRVCGLFVSLGYGFPVAQTLALLLTEAVRQRVDIDGQVYYVPVSPRHCVQGAPTSPGVCNALLLRLDRRLAGLAHRRGFVYTRYADDLTFSGDDVAAAHKLRAAAERIVGAEGFAINRSKTRISRRSSRQVVTGVVVNDVVGLSRQERRRLRAAIHDLGREPDAVRRQKLEAAVRGKLAYLHMLNPEQAGKLRARLRGRDLHP